MALAERGAVSAAERALARAHALVGELDATVVSAVLEVVPGFIALARARQVEDPREQEALRAHAAELARATQHADYAPVVSIGAFLQESLRR